MTLPIGSTPKNRNHAEEQENYSYLGTGLSELIDQPEDQVDQPCFYFVRVEEISQPEFKEATSE